MKELIHEYVITDKFVIFWDSCFSQWFLTNFTIRDIKFTSAEQYMMYMKAMYFKDEEIAKKILKERNPRTIKALGRMVKNFNDKEWDLVKLDIVIEGNYNKFSQNQELKNILLDTKFDNKEFVEGSPDDPIWGIGIHYKSKDATDKTKWKGLNLLGIAINKTRDIIIQENKNVR